MTLENVSSECQILENVSLVIPNEMMPKKLLLEQQIVTQISWGKGTFYRNGVNFEECDFLTTYSQEFDVLTTHSLTPHFIGETSVHYSLFTFICIFLTKWLRHVACDSTPGGKKVAGIRIPATFLRELWIGDIKYDLMKS